MRWPWQKGNRHAWKVRERLTGLVHDMECERCGERAIRDNGYGVYPPVWGCPAALPVPANAPRPSTESLPVVA